MRVADALALALESRGVEKIFSVTGGASGWLNDGILVSSRIETVFCHHEQAAVFAAGTDTTKYCAGIVLEGAAAGQLATVLLGNYGRGA